GQRGYAVAIWGNGVGRVARRRPAFHDEALRESACSGRHDVNPYRRSPSRLSEDGHVVRIAAECRDVVVYPLQRELLIANAVGTRRFAWSLLVQIWMGEEPERAQAIVHAHHDDWS